MAWWTPRRGAAKRSPCQTSRPACRRVRRGPTRPHTPVCPTSSFPPLLARAPPGRPGSRDPASTASWRVRCWSRPGEAPTSTGYFCRRLPRFGSHGALARCYLGRRLGSHITRAARPSCIRGKRLPHIRHASQAPSRRPRVLHACSQCGALRQGRRPAPRPGSTRTSASSCVCWPSASWRHLITPSHVRPISRPNFTTCSATSPARVSEALCAASTRPVASRRPGKLGMPGAAARKHLLPPA
jgi:hypothetical protein